jgi:ABC-type molybdate transport system substrate-binding protein
VLTARDVAQEVERLAADAGFGYVHVVVSGGRIERIDRCVQIKADRPETVLRRAAAQVAIRRG